MPLTGDQFEEREAEDILAFLEAEMRAEFGEDIDLTESSAFRTFATAISEVDAAEIEPALRQVHNAGFLESATGENLERLVSILGIQRRDAIHSTGVLEFDHGSITKSNYTISNGTIVQTDSNDPIEFETTELVTINIYDDFEGGSLSSSYIEDTADFTVVDGSNASDPSPTEGSFCLRSAATSGSMIIQDGKKVTRGTKMAFHDYLQDTDATQNAVIGNMFGVVDNSNYYRIKIDESGTHAIEKVTSAGGVQTLNDHTGLTIPSDEWLRNEVDWEGEEDGRIVSRLYDANDNLLSEITVTDENAIDAGSFGFISLDANENKYWDHSGEIAVQADARAREGGPQGNVGASSLTVMPSVPSGIDSVTNPWPMGDDDHRLTDTTQFAVGKATETDQELRDRATISEGALGRATIPALIANVSELPGAESVTVEENDTDTDNTGTGGLPPKSFEVIYYGTDPDQDIADTIFATKGITARDYGGAHGTEVTETVDGSNGQEFTIHWTTPNKLDIDMTLDIVVNDEFIGEDNLRDRIVSYIGGTSSDGNEVLGTGTGEDVYVDQVEDVVTGPDDTGVIGIGSYSFTPAVTTDANGLEIVDVGANEVGTTNATDGSITLNITRV